MPTKFKVKRSTVSGVTPTTGDIDTAELAINIPDRKLFTSNGTNVYELGSNQTNLSVSANLNIGASGDIVLTPGAGISANGGLGTAGYALHSNGSSVYWALPNSGISAIVSEQFTANGTSNSFTVTGGYIPSAIEVYVSGVKQVPVSDVIITSGSTVNFITAPLNGQVVDVFGYKSTNNISGYLALTGGTLGGNLIFANGSVIVANGSLGTSGQVLTSNGTSMYWDTATINVASQYAWTNTHTFAANVAFDTSTLFVDATNDEVGIGTTAPSAKLDVVGASNIRALEVTATISNTVATTYANYLDVNISGSDVLAADIIHAGFVVDVDSTATSGNTTTEHIVYGIWGTTDVTGPSNRIYGLYSDVRANNSVGTIGDLYGNYNLVEADPVTGGTISDVAGTFNLVSSGGNGAVTTMFGTYNRTLLETTGTPTLTNGYGSYNEIEIDGNAISNAYATRSVIDIDGGTITNGYLYYGDYQGGNTTNPTTSYGLYLTGERNNYFSGNVGIGNTAPDAKLAVTGTANVSGNVFVGGALTSANLTTTTNTSTIGTAAYFVANGNVGIGTSSPEYLLDVSASGLQTVRVKTTDTSGSNVARFSAQYSTTSTVDLRVGAGYGYLATLSATPMLFGTSDTERMRITSAGDIGIGNTAPNAKLQVTGTANISGAVAIGGVTTFNANVVLGSSGLSANGGFGTAGQVLTSNGTAAYWTTATAVATVNTAAQFAWTNTHTFAANVTFDTTTLFVDATNDRVGIGNTAPNAKLQVTGTANISSTVIIGGALTSANLATTTNTATFGTATYIVANGNIGIGTASPGTKLDISGSSYITGSLGVGVSPTYKIDVSGSGTSIVSRGWSANNTQSAGMHFMAINNGGTGDTNVAGYTFHCSGTYATHMHLRADGYIGMGGWSASPWRWYVNMTNGDMTAAGNVTAYSDPRLKEDITKIDSPVDTVMKLNGVRFRWKDTSVIGHPGAYDYGVLANEVQEVLPEIVRESCQESPDGDKYKTVDYTRIVPLLIEAIKEQQKQIEIQNENIKRLQVEIERLKE